MATTFTDLTGDGNNNKAFSFPSIKVADIRVDVDNVIKTQSTHYNVTNYTTTGGGTIVFTSGNIPAVGAAIRIYRYTEVDTPLASFAAGSSVKAGDLNDNFTQLLYAIDEKKTQTLLAREVKDGIITSAKITNATIATADVADDAIDATKVADDAIVAAAIADDAIVSAAIADDAVVTAAIADDAVTADQLANTAVTAGSYTLSAITVDAQGRLTSASSGSIAAGNIANDAITTAKIADDAVTADKLANSINTEIAANTAKTTNATHTGDVTGSGALTIATGAVTTAKLAADAVDGTKIADDAIDSEHYAAGSIDEAHIAASQVTGAKIAADAIDGTKIADDAINSEHYVDGSIDNAHLADSAVDTQELADNAVTIGKIGCEETTITDDDTKVPTSGAVVDYVSTQLATVGGFETIATDAAFPNSQPASGIIVSIADAGGLVVNGSGVSTTGRTVGASTVTINGINSQFNSTTVAAGVAFMVESTGSGHIYNYHKATLKEADLINLSSDIDDFGNRYRVASSAPGSSNDEGDLYFDTTANKMYVHDGSAWGQVTSTGEFKILGVKDNGQAHNGTGPTFNGSNDQFDLFESTSDASISQASQLIVVLNGVVQKPNDGTWSGSEEGFYLDGADGIKFCDPPASGSTLFITKCGSATSIAVPADNSVTAGKTDISIVQGDVIYGNGTDSWTRLAKGTAGQVLKMNSGATAPEWGTDNNDTLTEEQVEDFVGGMVTGNTETGITVTYQDGDGTLDFVVADQTPEGTAILSTGETGGTKFLREDGDNSCSWQTAADATKLPLAGGTITGDVVFDNGTNAGKDMTWDVSADALILNDDVQLQLGTGSDMRFYHTGSHGYLNVVTGNLEIRTNGSEAAITCTANAGVDLYYDTSQEFATVSGGVKLYGHSESIVTALTSASNVTIDFSLSNHFSCTMGHNITFANPTTESVGQSGTIVLTQDGTGSRTASWGSQFLWAGGTAPTLSTAAAAVDRIDYFVAAADKIHCVASLAMA